jgi:hypothetical protein
MSPRPVRILLAGAAALIVAMPAASSATPRHHSAARKTAPPNDVTTWLATCRASEIDCVIGVSEARASFQATQAILHDPDYCVPAADDDSHLLAPKVTAWLKDHPDHGRDPEYSGINAALASLYPCGH